MKLNIKNILNTLYQFFEVTLILSAVVVLCYIFVGQLLEVSGDSMFPTFHDKEQLVAEKLTIKYEPPKRGEILIVEHPNEPGMLLIKRVIGLPGEVITIKNGYVYINGNILDEPYLTDSVTTEGGLTIKDGIDYRIPDDSYVFMGDNREKSTDSRYYGNVKMGNIVGRGLFVYYPIKNFRFL